MLTNQAPELSTAQKSEAILLMLFEKMNWGAEVSLAWGEDSDGKAFAHYTSAVQVFEVLVPLHKGDNPLKFPEIVDSLYNELATVLGRGIR